MANIILTQLSESALKTIIYDVMRTALSNHQVSLKDGKTAEPFIKGIHGLAKFLSVSPARAQKLKNEGVIPFWQDGRTLLFDPEKVREAMNNK